jgi:hypothetical protein
MQAPPRVTVSFKNTIPTTGRCKGAVKSPVSLVQPPTASCISPCLSYSRYSPDNWARKQQTTALCGAALTCISFPPVLLQHSRLAFGCDTWSYGSVRMCSRLQPDHTIAWRMGYYQQSSRGLRSYSVLPQTLCGLLVRFYCGSFLISTAFVLR